MKYTVIYADPPWTFKVWTPAGNGRSAVQHYALMTTDDLCALPVASIADDDCALALWVTWPCLQDALRVGAAWSFEYKTCLFDWVKQTPDGIGWHTGLGYYTRANSEPCLLFIRGNPLKRLDAGVQQIIVDADSMYPLLGAIIAPVRRHSQKPIEAYQRIERLWGNVPRIELFARRRRDGWDSIGYEIDGQDIREALIACQHLI